MTWLARILLIAGGVVASWFVAKDTPAFTIAQGMMAIVLLTILVLLSQKAAWCGRGSEA
jgi:hypothetical protein